MYYEDDMPIDDTCEDASTTRVEAPSASYLALLDVVNAEAKIEMKDGIELGAGH